MVGRHFSQVPYSLVTILPSELDIKILIQESSLDAVKGLSKLSQSKKDNPSRLLDQIFSQRRYRQMESYRLQNVVIPFITQKSIDFASDFKRGRRFGDIC